MQTYEVQNSLFDPKNIKYVEINNYRGIFDQYPPKYTIEGYKRIWSKPDVLIKDKYSILSKNTRPSTPKSIRINHLYNVEEFNENASSCLRSMNPVPNKNFLNGLKNAHNLLEDLKRSLQKTSKYEKRLLRCKSSHSHSHSNECRDSEDSEEKDSKSSKADTVKTSRSQVDLAESWSTMSIVCLQYQYEELSKRYEALLRAYDERCRCVSARDASLARVRTRATVAQARLVNANKAVLTVGEKYLSLKCKKHVQKCWYENKVEQLKNAVRAALAAAACARLELDARLTGQLADEKDADYSVLLAEIKKCNRLCLENLQLKAQIEELASTETCHAGN